MLQVSCHGDTDVLYGNSWTGWDPGGESLEGTGILLPWTPEVRTPWQQSGVSNCLGAGLGQLRETEDALWERGSCFHGEAWRTECWVTLRILSGEDCLHSSPPGQGQTKMKW